MTETGNKPLANLRILDLGTMVAGPAAATLMADLGADVIKVEQPNGGDTLRALGPFVEGESLWWNVEGRNKRSVTIDLRQAEGQELLKKLVATADVVIENFRPGTMDNWNLGYEALRKVRKNLIMLSISGFGQTGPYAKRAGYDRIGMAFSGVLGITGFPDRPPVKVGTSLADYSTATLGAFAVMVALHARSQTGDGQHIDLALYEPVFRYTDSMIPAFTRLDKPRERTGNVHQAAAPGDTFITRDGRYVIVTISGEVLFRKLCNAMDMERLLADPRFVSHSKRWENVTVINDIVATWIAGRDSGEMAERFERHGVPYSYVYTTQDILDDPHYAARGNIVTVDNPRIGPVRMPGPVPRFSGFSPAAPVAAPTLGEHNNEVFGSVLGLAPEAVASLHERGVV